GARPGPAEKGRCGRGPNQPGLHHHPRPNRRHCGGPQRGRGTNRGRIVAGANAFYHCPGLTKMQVYAKTDESDVGQIRPGQKVTFKVDAYPRDTFSGVVSQVRMNSTVVQNVVTYDTIVDFNNPELKLFPGMTAYVTIPVATAGNVVKVPNGALRYKPDMSATELEAVYQKYGLPENGGRAHAVPTSGAGNGGDPRPHEGAPGHRPQANSTVSSSSGDVTAPRYDTQVVWKLL